MFTLNGSIEQFTSSRLNKGIILALNENRYKIFYTFDTDREIITYEACLLEKRNNEALPEFLKVSITSSGKMTHDGSDELYYFIVKNDKEREKADIASLERDYAPIKEVLNSLKGKDEKELESRHRSRESFTKLIDSLLDSDIFLLDGGTFDLDLKIFLRNFNQSGILELTLIAGSQSFKLNSISQFIEKVNEEDTIHFDDAEFRLMIDSFTPYARKLIEILPSVLSGGYKEEITTNGLTRLLNELRGSKVKIAEWKNKDRIIEFNCLEEVLPTEIYIDDNGNVTTTPSVNGMLFTSLGLGAILDPLKEEIQIISFKDTMSKKVFEFASNDPTFNYQDVKDLIAQKFYPLMADKAKISQNFKSEHVEKSFAIKYFVDFNEDGALSFKTEFHVDDLITSKKDAVLDFARMKRIKTFESVIERLSLPENGEINDDDMIINFLTMDLKSLKRVCHLYLSDAIMTHPAKRMEKIKVNVALKMNWLNVDIDYSQYSKEELIELINAYKKKKKFVRLKNQTVILDDDMMHDITKLQEEVGLDDKLNLVSEVPLYQVFNIMSFENGISLSEDEQITNIIKKIKNFKESVEVPNKSILEVLRPYQLDAWKWLNVLRNNHLGGILADDMGLGKTLELISFITTLKEETPILVVSPKAVLYNWENEIQKWNSKIKCKIIHGTKSERKRMIKAIKLDKKVIYLTSYDSLRNDIEEYKDKVFEVAVLDEAQYIKNASALKTIAVKQIEARTRFVLTGTPIENSLQDLWSIFDFLMPGYLLNQEAFKMEYEVNMEQEDNTITKKRLSAKIAPFILRRTKEEVLKDLPPKVENTILIDMDDNQRKLYNSFLLNAQTSLKENKAKQIQVLAALTRLREICVDPSMFIEDFVDIPVKLEVCKDYIYEAINTGHKVLLFSSFVKSLNHLEAILKEDKIETYKIVGSTPAKDRLEIANKFNDENSKVKVCLISLKAGGTGLNLVGADIVIHLDPWWNVAAENQASDRAYRIGQTRNVNVIKMIVKNTIEEKVILLQEKKKEIVEAVIREGNDSISSLTDEDIKFLLS